jgi:hypothetical protein
MSMLEAQAPDNIELPHTGKQFEAWAADFPPLRCAVMPLPLQTGNAWLGNDFRVGAHLDTLVSEAQSFGFQFGYQVHFRRFMPTARQMRRIGHNLIALESMPNVPTEIVADQRRQAQAFSSARLLIEEIVATAGEDGARWLKGTLARLFRSVLGPFPADTPGPRLPHGRR